MPKPADPNTHIYYQQQYRKCGSAKSCKTCAEGQGHGPYWFGYFYERDASGKRKLRSWYIGKHFPTRGDPQSAIA